MIAFRRIDVADLNGLARALMRASGALGDTEVVLDGRPFAVGDRVQLRRNDRRLGVANGERGVIASVDPSRGELNVQLAGRRMRLDDTYLRRGDPRRGPSLVHGYAITGHSAQGLTAGEAFVLVSSEASREWVYTALSRGRDANRLYALAPEPEDRAEIAPETERKATAREAVSAAVQRSSAQTLASEVAGTLSLAVYARDAAQEQLADATRNRESLEQRQPSALRPFARARHSAELGAAHQRERDARRGLDERLERERVERARLESVRKQRPEPEPEQPRARRRSAGRGWELGR
jgi:hypothetical protein